MTLSPQQIFEAAESAAKDAAIAHNNTLPPENQRGFDCGFAWVVVKPARGPFISWCRTHKKGWHRDYGEGGWEFPCSGYHPTQSISTHAAAAKAFAATLEATGIVATTHSRLD